VTLIESEQVRKDTARQDCIGALRYVGEFCSGYPWIAGDPSPIWLWKKVYQSATSYARFECWRD
jgi:hypothetical protein